MYVLCVSTVTIYYTCNHHIGVLCFDNMNRVSLYSKYMYIIHVCVNKRYILHGFPFKELDTNRKCCACVFPGMGKNVLAVSNHHS